MASSISKKKLIVDVDTGVDDAQAIMMALCATDKCDLLAITCVSGNTNVDQACYNTMRVLKACRRPDVSVYKGADTALVRPRPVSNAPHHGDDGLGGVPDSNPPDMSKLQAQHAVTAMTMLARQHKGEITLVALGPLTNIALALRMDKNFGANLKNAVIMGGNIEGQGNVSPSAEFNFFSDPEAAFVVLENLQCPTQLVSWEPCLKNGIEWEWYDEFHAKTDTQLAQFHNAITQFSTNRKKEKYAKYYSCDPMAMMIALYPECILTSQKVYCRVELQGEITRGQMVVDWMGKLGHQPNVELIKEIDVEHFKKRLQEMLV